MQQMVLPVPVTQWRVRSAVSMSVKQSFCVGDMPCQAGRSTANSVYVTCQAWAPPDACVLCDQCLLLRSTLSSNVVLHIFRLSWALAQQHPSTEAESFAWWASVRSTDGPRPSGPCATGDLQVSSKLVSLMIKKQTFCWLVATLVAYAPQGSRSRGKHIISTTTRHEIKAFFCWWAEQLILSPVQAVYAHD